MAAPVFRMAFSESQTSAGTESTKKKKIDGHLQHSQSLLCSPPSSTDVHCLLRHGRRRGLLHWCRNSVVADLLVYTLPGSSDLEQKTRWCWPLFTEQRFPIVFDFSGHLLQVSILASLFTNLDLREWELSLVSRIAELQMFLAPRRPLLPLLFLFFNQELPATGTSTSPYRALSSTAL